MRSQTTTTHHLPHRRATRSSRLVSAKRTRQKGQTGCCEWAGAGRRAGCGAHLRRKNPLIFLLTRKVLPTTSSEARQNASRLETYPYGSYTSIIIAYIRLAAYMRDHLGEEEGARARKRGSSGVEDGRRGERDRESSEKSRTACLEDVWECKCRGDGSIKERRSLARARRKRASTLVGTRQGRGQNELKK